MLLPHILRLYCQLAYVTLCTLFISPSRASTEWNTHATRTLFDTCRPCLSIIRKHQLHFLFYYISNKCMFVLNQYRLKLETSWWFRHHYDKASTSSLELSKLQNSDLYWQGTHSKHQWSIYLLTDSAHISVSHLHHDILHSVMECNN